VRSLFALFAAVALVLLSVEADTDQGGQALFRDVASEAGITFQHHAAPEKKYIVESMSGGVAVFDYDNDGRPDIYLLDSLTVDTAGNPSQSRSALYRNLGGMRFEDVTSKSGLGSIGWGMGACTADVDGDGFEDVYVTALGGSHYFHNNRDGTFSDATQAAGLAVSAVKSEEGTFQWLPFLYQAGGSIDKLLMTWVEQSVGAAALAVSGSNAVVDTDDVALKVYLYSRAQSVMGGTSQIQKNIIATRILGLPTT
jgi:hypothetical protein